MSKHVEVLKILLEQVENIRDCAQIECEMAMVSECSEQIEALTAAIEAMTWISVGERLPEDEQSCLVCTISGFIVSAMYFIDRDFFICMNGNTHQATHWMPLPNPPKEV